MTTYNSASFVHLGLTTDEVDNLINSLAVTYADFAQMTSLYSRAYGVISDSEQGPTGPESEKLRSFVLNDCVRNAIWEGLFQTQMELERFVGFNFTERYHTQEVEWSRRNKFYTEFPGVESLEVELNWYDIPDGVGGATTQVTVSPYIIEGAVVIVDPDDASKFAIVVDATLTGNPEDLIFRRDDDNRTIAVDPTSYPRYDSIADTWTVRLNHLVPTPVSAGVLVNIQHRNLVAITYTDPDTSTLPAGGSVFPVYPGTSHIIPFARSSEDLGGGQTRIFLYAYTLVKPDFRFRTVYWNRGEYHKVYNSIELKYRVEEVAYVALVWVEGNDEYVYQFDPAIITDQANVELEIASPRHGIISMWLNSTLQSDLHLLESCWRVVCGGKRIKMPETVYLRLKYKTNPVLMGEKNYQQIPSFRKAIAAKTAANLPLQDCDCPVEVGFIATHQMPYNTVIGNTLTGYEIHRAKYGNLHGHFVYAEIVNNAKIYRRPLLVGRGI